MIPITRLSVGEEEAQAAAEVVRSGWLTAGKRGQAFEQAVADYVGAQHGVAVNSCTTALHLALIAAGVGPGDEVICPSFSFIASANAILYAGATPVFVDIDPRTFNIDANLIEKAITERTKALMPVSQIGLGADLTHVADIATRHGLRVVEDAAPSLGAIIDGRRVGSISEFTCFSFDARKVLTMGEGGLITTNDEEAANRLRQLRAHGASVSLDERHRATTVIIEEYPELGYNYKLTDIQAAIGLVQMKKVDTVVAERRRLAARYAELLGMDDRLELPYEPPGYVHIYQCYCIRLRNGLASLPVMRHMSANGVSSRRIMAIHEEPYYRRIMPGVRLPETESAARKTLLLPIFVGLTDAEQDQVASALSAAITEAARESAAQATV
jgi:dTDP-4-amino-4,6-dideoxygalactose transaminase